jgi:hypothetical protein
MMLAGVRGHKRSFREGSKKQQQQRELVLAAAKQAA